MLGYSVVFARFPREDEVYGVRVLIHRTLFTLILQLRHRERQGKWRFCLGISRPLWTIPQAKNSNYAFRLWKQSFTNELWTLENSERTQ